MVNGKRGGAIRAALLSSVAPLAIALFSGTACAQPIPLIEDKSGANGVNGYSAFWEWYSDDNYGPTAGENGQDINVDIYDPINQGRDVGVGLTSNGGIGGAAYEARNYAFVSDPAPVSGAPGGNGGTITATLSNPISLGGTAPDGLVQITSNGGQGGDGQSFADPTADAFTRSGTGGDGGTVNLNVTADLLFGGKSTQNLIGPVGSGPSGITVMANGADGGSATGTSNTYPATGGMGGDGGTVSINIDDATLWNDSTQPGYLLSASADAGNGGVGGSQENTFEQSYGGDSGFAGSVNISIGSGAIFNSTGDGVVGILAEANGGLGGAAGSGGSNGIGGNSFGGGNVSVDVSGTITTTGSASYGVVAQTFGGDGAPGTPSFGFFFAGGNTGGDGGYGGNVTATLESGGTIITGGAGAAGILAQSIAGGGGNGGTADAAVAVGGDGGDSGNGGSATVTNLGSVSTTGDGAHGIIALSTAGGGGVALGSDSARAANESGGGGGGTKSIFFGHGGTAGSGGNGGAVDVLQAGSVSTTGSNSHAIIAHSIAGGGGVGGGTYSGAPFISVGIGGKGGEGGGGGTVDINQDIETPPTSPMGSITTNGPGSYGINAGSIGGGGGDGGGSWAIGLGVPVSGVSVGASITIGGEGAQGGTGGAVNVNNISTITTMNDDSIGIYAHSIGGGGGSGGAATAYTAVPSAGDDSVISLSASIAVGGNAADGATAGAVTLNNWAEVTTHGDQSTALKAHSIGGGGGHGGNAHANSATYGIGGGLNASVAVAVGGTAGIGSHGNTVNLTNTQALSTVGTRSHGIDAKSIGGGGGSGGAGGTYSVPGLLIGGKSNTATVAVGGDGALSGDGGTVNVTNSGSIATIGKDAKGIFAQSVGGGGGEGGGAQGDAAATNVTIDVDVGAKGGAAGDGGTVTVTNDAGGTVTTQGHGGTGILAQSVGGGGGHGGTATATNTLPYYLDYAGDANSAYSFYKDLRGSSKIQDINSGKAAEDPTKPLNLFFNVTVGGAGNTAGDGGEVTVTNDASITTNGDAAPGILAHSIGGGGGVAGAASAAGGVKKVSVMVGTDGGNGGSGGAVTLTNTGAVTTTGNFSVGVIGQSIGGGGGNGGIAVPKSSGLTSIPSALNVRIGGNAANASDGGTVTLNNAGTVQTRGHFSHAVVAQSIGGGGGNHFIYGQVYSKDGVATTNTAPVYETPGTPSTTGGNASGNKLGINVSLGGDGGAGGTGNNVSLTNSAGLQTQGDETFGILAQSIGGGGGTGGKAAELLPFFSASNGGAAGEGASSGWIDIALNGGKIATSGTGAAGVVAQAVAGGGGHVGGNTDLTMPESSYHSTDQNVDTFGGAVVIQSNTDGTPETPNSIVTTGVGAHGIFAQSTAGYGGSVGSFAGMATVMNPDAPTIDDVYLPTAAQGVLIDYTGDISATGKNSVAIYAETSQVSPESRPNTFLIDNLSDPNALFGVLKGARTKLEDTNIATGAEYSPGTGGNGAIQIAVDGDITGGSGPSGAGIAIVGGRGNTIDVQGGSVSAGPGGYAIAATLPLSLELANTGTSTLFPDDPTPVGEQFTYNTLVTNQGTINGNVDLSTGRNRFFNSGTFNPGETVTISGNRSWGTIFAKALVNQQTVTAGSIAQTTDGSFVNTGTVNVAGPGVIGTSTFTTDTFQQTASGTLGVDVDLATGTADFIDVTGQAQLEGTVVPTITGFSTSSDAVEFFAADSVAASTLTVQDTIATDYELIATTTALSLRSQIQLSNISASTSAAGAVASHFDDLISTGSTGEMGGDIATLANLPVGHEAEYNRRLTDLSGDQATYANGFGNVAKVRGTQDQLHSCNVFEGDDALMTEESCLYFRGLGGYSEGATGWSGREFSSNWGAAAFGGQVRIGDGLYLGAIASAGQSSVSAKDDSYTTDTDDMSVGAVLKYMPTPRTELAFSATYTKSSVDQTRYVSGRTARAQFDTDTVGLRGKISRQYAHQNYYIEPSFQIDALHIDVPAYNETGAGSLDLFYSAKQDWRVSATPGIEIGQRIDRGSSQLRTFANAGVSFWDKNDFSQSLSFRGAPAGTGFTSTAVGPDTTLNLGVGAELVQDSGLSFEGRYNLRTDGDFNDHRLTARVRWRF